MGRFEDVEDELTKQEDEEGEDEEDFDFSAIDAFSKRDGDDEATPEDEFEAIRKKLMKLAYGYKAMCEARDNEYKKAFIDLFGLRDSDTDFGIEGRIDDEFEDPRMKGLDVEKYWNQYRDKVKTILLIRKQTQQGMEQYLKEYMQAIKIILKLYLTKEKQVEKLQKEGAIDEDQVIKVYFAGLDNYRIRQLVQMYDECEDLKSFRNLVHPGNRSTGPADRMYLRALNQVKQKFAPSQKGAQTNEDDKEDADDRKS